MSQSLAKISVHLVFSTAGRTPLLDAGIRPKLFAYLAGIFKTWESPAVIVGGVNDHVHSLFQLSKNYSLAKLVEEVKKGSSKWIKTRGKLFTNFHWQNGYGAFSVSESNIEQVKKYIAEQEKHHRKLSFQDEFRILLKRYNVTFDEAYLWD